MRLSLVALPLAVVAGILAIPSAKALTDTQSTSGTAFSVSGTSSAASFPATLSFARFDPSSVAAPRTNIRLTGYTYEITLGSIGGNLTANVDGTAPSPITVGANGTFNIKPLTPLSGSDVTIGPFPATFSGTNPVPNTGTNTLLTASGSATGTSNPFSLITNDPNFVSPPSTLASASSYFTSWTITPSDPKLLTNNGSALTVNGTIRVNWIYDYDLPPSAATPGPLPLLGAGAAFGWSRRLRKRISATV